MNIRLSMLLAGLVVAACASSGQVVKTFELAKPAGAPFSRLLVVGAHKDRGMRQQFEQTMVGALREHQIDALSSIENMPSGEELTPATVGATAEEAFGKASARGATCGASGADSGRGAASGPGRKAK